MADDVPIVEQIAQAILSRLDSISVSNGYSFDIVNAVRPTRFNGYSPEHLMLVLEQGDPDVDYENSEFGFIAWSQPFFIHCFVRPADTSSVVTDTIINTLRSDVEKAIMIDPTWSGLASGTFVQSPQGWSYPDGSFEGVTVNVEVKYKTLSGDPFSV